MDISCKLAILDSLSNLNNCSIIKMPANFPESIKIGDDVDILSSDLDLSIASLIKHLNKFNLFSILVRRTKTYSHLDLYIKSKFIYRFDIIKSFTHFQRLRIKNRFISDLIESSVYRTISLSGQTFVLRVPNSFYESLMRLIEYSEYYWVGPDKIQHLNYILDSQIASDKYFLALHDYTKISEEIAPIPRATFYDKFKGDVSRVYVAFKALPWRLCPQKTLQLILKVLGHS